MVADRILLIGMMGAGKTTVGAALSRLLGWPYRDNDDVLVAATGSTARELQGRDGIAALRRAESAVLAAALDAAPPLIASVAAGVVTDPLDLERLASCGAFVVWLRVDIDRLASRVAGTGRPLLGADPAADLRVLYAGRESLYAAVADLMVDSENTTAELTARRIAEAMASRGKDFAAKGQVANILEPKGYSC